MATRKRVTSKAKMGKSKTTSGAARARRRAGASATAKKQAKLIAKQWSDSAFRQQLISYPAETLRKEGFDVPEGVQVKVIEDTADTFHIVIPHATNVGTIERLYEVLMGKGCSSCAHCHKKGKH